MEKNQKEKDFTLADMSKLKAEIQKKFDNNYRNFLKEINLKALNQLLLKYKGVNFTTLSKEEFRSLIAERRKESIDQTMEYLRSFQK